jgi:hypothetical protein
VDDRCVKCGHRMLYNFWFDLTRCPMCEPAGAGVFECDMGRESLWAS